MLLIRKLHIISLAMLLLMVAQDLPAQRKAKKVRIRHHSNHELFEVTKKRNGVRHGSYERFLPESGQIIEAGSYNMGEKVGVWQYFYRGLHDPYLEQIYNHSLDSLLYICAYDSDYTSEFGPQEMPVTFDSPAIHIGGEEHLYNLVIDQVDRIIGSRKFDEPAFLKSRPNGRVGISFIIAEDGKLTVPSVVTHLNEICDQLVLDAVRAMETRWIPAYMDGAPFSTGKTIYIDFSYSESLNYSGPVRKMVAIDRERPSN